MLKKLMDDGGDVLEGHRMKSFIADHYRNLFLSYAGEQYEEVLSCVTPCVTQEMNDALLAPFSIQEVWAAPGSIGDLKALGADGMPSVFYKKNVDSCR